MVPSSISMKKALAIRVVTKSGERLFFIYLVYERSAHSPPLPADGSAKGFLIR